MVRACPGEIKLNLNSRLSSRVVRRIRAEGLARPPDLLPELLVGATTVLCIGPFRIFEGVGGRRVTVDPGAPFPMYLVRRLAAPGRAH
jgi:hypothetical protein